MAEMEVKARGQVLFVDDDPFFREMAAGALDDAGVEVALAADGTSALLRAAEHVFDVIVLDLEMPGMSGFEVLSQLRADPRHQHVPILVITGHDDTASIEKAYDLGATSFLAKPLNWLLFVHHIAFLQRSGQTDAERRDAIREAEMLSELKSRLVSALVTDVQAPLRAALGSATLLRREADGPIASGLYRSWIADLYSALEKLSATHVKMLNFGRVLAEGITLKEDTVVFSTFLDRILDDVDEQARRRGLEFTRPPGRPNLYVRCDPARLAQALRGIFDHAVRFSARDSKVEIELKPGAGGDLVLRITDTSAGLTQAEIADILDTAPMARAGSDSSPTPGSTGLKVSRVLVEAHQGSIALTSVSGEGLMVTLTLPVARIVAAPRQMASSAKPSAASSEAGRECHAGAMLSPV